MLKTEENVEPMGPLGCTSSPSIGDFPHLVRQIHIRVFFQVQNREPRVETSFGMRYGKLHKKRATMKLLQCSRWDLTCRLCVLGIQISCVECHNETARGPVSGADAWA